MRLVLDGASLYRTCHALNDEGHRTTKGSLWTPSTLNRTLRRSISLGIAATATTSTEMTMGSR